MDFKGPNGCQENIRWGEGLFQKCDGLSNSFQSEANCVSVWAASVMTCVRVCVPKCIQKTDACGVSVTSRSAFQPRIVTDWQTEPRPKIGQRKTKTDGQDGELARALTCSLQAPFDLLYFPPFSPLLVPALCPPASVIPFHVAQGTNKSKEGLPPDTTLIPIFYITLSFRAGRVTPVFSKPRPTALANQPWRLSFISAATIQQPTFFFFFFLMKALLSLAPL